MAAPPTVRFSEKTAVSPIPDDADFVGMRDSPIEIGSREVVRYSRAAMEALVKDISGKFPLRFTRDKGYKYFIPRDGSLVGMVLQIIIWGQSLSNGTQGAYVYSVYGTLFPSICRMLVLADGSASLQGPRVVPGLDPQPATIALAETFERPDPTYTDAISGEIVTPSVNLLGETPATGMADAIVKELVAAGLDLTGFEIVISVVGKGGEGLTRITQGSNTGIQYAKTIKAGHDYAQAGGQEGGAPKGYMFAEAEWHGEDDSSNDEIENLTDQNQPALYANKKRNKGRWVADTLRRETGLAGIEPMCFMSQCGSTYTSTWPPVDKRLANTATAQLNLAKSDPDHYKLLNSSEVSPLTDRLHPEGGGYNLNGACAGVPMAQTLLSNHDWQHPWMIDCVAAGPRDIYAIFDTSSSGPLRFWEYEPQPDIAIVDPGSGWPNGARARTVGMSSNATVVLTTDGSAITGAEFEEPGSNLDYDPTGALTLVPVISGATVVTPGVRYADGAHVSPTTGIGRRVAVFLVHATPIRLVAGVLTGGLVTSLEELDEGDYDINPDAAGPMTGGGQGATGLTATMIAAGTGGSIAIHTVKQFALNDTTPLIQGSAIVDPGSGITVGMVLTENGPDAMIADLLGERAVITVTLAPGGGMTLAGLTKPGRYRVAPYPPYSFSDGAGHTVLLDIPIGGFPVASPGLGRGFDFIDDNSAKGDGITGAKIASVTVVDWKLYQRSAVHIRLDSDMGSDPWIFHGQHTYGQNGGASGARTTLGSEGFRNQGPGAFGVWPRAMTARDALPVRGWAGLQHTPAAPIVKNPLFSDGVAGSSMVITTAGSVITDDWRAYSAGGVRHGSIVLDEENDVALRIGRDQGDSDTSTISLTQIYYGRDVHEKRGKPLALGQRMKRGSGLANVLTQRVYYHTDLTTFSTSIPSGATSLFLASKTLTTSYDEYATSGGPAVILPTDAEVMLFYNQYIPTGTALADEYFQWKLPRLNPGTQDRPFDAAAMMAEYARRMNQISVSIADGLYFAPMRGYAFGASTFVMVANTFYAVPCNIQTIAKGIAIGITAGSSGKKVRAALYAAGRNKFTPTYLVEDLGEKGVTSTGILEYTFAKPRVIEGPCWLVIWSDGTPTIQAFTATAASLHSEIGRTTLSTTTIGSYYTNASLTYGAFPTQLPSLSLQSSATPPCLAVIAKV